jgi:hypothetical protein
VDLGWMSTANSAVIGLCQDLHHWPLALGASMMFAYARTLLLLR